MLREARVEPKVSILGPLSLTIVSQMRHSSSQIESSNLPHPLNKRRPNYGHCHQCSRLKSSMPFKRDLALHNILLSKQPFETQPQIENEDVI